MKYIIIRTALYSNTKDQILTELAAENQSTHPTHNTTVAHIPKDSLQIIVFTLNIEPRKDSQLLHYGQKSTDLFVVYFKRISFFGYIT